MTTSSLDYFQLYIEGNGGSAKIGLQIGKQVQKRVNVVKKVLTGKTALVNKLALQEETTSWPCRVDEARCVPVAHDNSLLYRSGYPLNDDGDGDGDKASLSFLVQLQKLFRRVRPYALNSDRDVDALFASVWYDWAKKRCAWDAVAADHHVQANLWAVITGTDVPFKALESALTAAKYGLTGLAALAFRVASYGGSPLKLRYNIIRSGGHSGSNKMNDDALTATETQFGLLSGYTKARFIGFYERVDDVVLAGFRGQSWAIALYVNVFSRDAEDGNVKVNQLPVDGLCFEWAPVTASVVDLKSDYLLYDDNRYALASDYSRSYIDGRVRYFQTLSLIHELKAVADRDDWARTGVPDRIKNKAHLQSAPSRFMLDSPLIRAVTVGAHSFKQPEYGDGSDLGFVEAKTAYNETWFMFSPKTDHWGGQLRYIPFHKMFMKQFTRVVDGWRHSKIWNQDGLPPVGAEGFIPGEPEVVVAGFTVGQLMIPFLMLPVQFTDFKGSTEDLFSDSNNDESNNECIVDDTALQQHYKVLDARGCWWMSPVINNNTLYTFCDELNSQLTSMRRCEIVEAALLGLAERFWADYTCRCFILIDDGDEKMPINDGSSTFHQLDVRVYDKPIIVAASAPLNEDGIICRLVEVMKNTAGSKRKRC